MTDRPLIVGAGPTGLAAALFLSRKGVETRIIDAAPKPSTTSRALAVNPRSLSLLEGTGVEAAILAEGLGMNTLLLHDEGRPIGEIHIDYRGMGADHPMTILPQARTEALLAEALARRGLVVERGIGIGSLVQNETGVSATLIHADGSHETARAPLLLGADGAHSVVRHQLGLGFPGSAFPEEWQLMDVEIEGAPESTGWIDFSAEGPLVVLPFNGRAFRLIGFGRPLLERLPKAWKVGKVIWSSGFHISHRIADAMAAGRVALAGDAAHIHSPIGARGMNLGIEDAYVFAACAERFLGGEAGVLEAYGKSRRHFDGQVVAKIERLTRIVRQTKGAVPVLRRLAIPVLAHLKPVQRLVARQGLGLDHPLIIP